LKSHIKIIEEPTSVYLPDYVEITKGGIKLKVAINIDRPIEAYKRIDEGLGLREYALNALLIQIDKLDNREKKA
jgi:hypothetical protein